MPCLTSHFLSLSFLIEEIFETNSSWSSCFFSFDLIFYSFNSSSNRSSNIFIIAKRVFLFSNSWEQLIERRLSVILSDFSDFNYYSDYFFYTICFFLSYSGALLKYSSCFLNYFIIFCSNSSNSKSNCFFYFSKSSLTIKFNLGTFTLF